MPRLARLVIPGWPHHITHRGNDGQIIFHDESDHRQYLLLLRNYSRIHNLSLLGYCLMGNHVHLIGVPQQKDSLAKIIGYTHLRHAQRFNVRHEHIGHLWQGRYYSCVMDQAHLITAMRYVERNPVRAGLVRFAWDYPWSSARAHCGFTEDYDLLDLSSWQQPWPAAIWREKLLQTEDEKELRLLRLHTMKGKPFAGKDFCRNF